jgi:hypothetical protein
MIFLKIGWQNIYQAEMGFMQPTLHSHYGYKIIAAG